METPHNLIKNLESSNFEEYIQYFFFSLLSSIQGKKKLVKLSIFNFLFIYNFLINSQICLQMITRKHVENLSNMGAVPCINESAPASSTFLNGISIPITLITISCKQYPTYPPFTGHSHPVKSQKGKALNNGTCSSSSLISRAQDNILILLHEQGKVEQVLFFVHFLVLPFRLKYT